MTKLFYDFEFTGLRQDTTPISLGVSTYSGLHFYAELTDYDTNQVDDWIQENVIDNLMNLPKDGVEILGAYTFVKGDRNIVGKAFREWISTHFTSVEFWGDCSWYDGVLLNELFEGAFNLPESVNYIFFDIATLMQVFGVDPDIDRESFIDHPIEFNSKHNALYDSQVIEACYYKLIRNKDKYLNSGKND